MKIYFPALACLVLCTQLACAQHTVSDPYLPALKEVTADETFLASDALRGRKTFSPDIVKASSFIEDKFRADGLTPFFGNDFKESFFLNTTTNVSSSLLVNGKVVPDSLYLALSGTAHINLKADSFNVVTVPAGMSMAERRTLLTPYFQAGSLLKNNVLVVLDPSLRPYMARMKHNSFPSLVNDQKTVLFVFGTAAPVNIEYKAENTISRQALNNVAAVLPGTERPDEYVIFSAHYDHLGTGPSPSAMREPVPGQDSIFNGANDDASGTTAVIELARYFSRTHTNKRSIIFVTFTAEEIGEYGSQYFSMHVDNQKVIAMFNIEMIGTGSKWGNNAAYITGYDKTDFGKILQKNLKGSAFNFYPDPYPAQNLFYRSDNAQLALKGVPAHTISTSKMDDEHNYHTPQDEISTLDLTNMTQIIDAIAISSKGIISGKDTPGRVTQ